MERREFMKVVGVSAASVALGGCVGGMERKSFKKKPNIVFITTDYQSGEDGPSLGSPFLDMPGLDRLCKDGVVFDRSYSTAPVCMPERFTWITGQYPHTHGKWGNGGGWVKEGSPLMGDLLRDSGYYSLAIGKMHFVPWDNPGGFDRRITADRKGNVEWDSKHQDDYAKFLATHGLTRWDYLKLAYESETPHVYDWPFAEECHIDSYVGDQAAGAISNGEMDDKGPWFMWVSFNGPHNPWDPPVKYSKPYLDMDLPLPKVGPEALDDATQVMTWGRYGYTKEVADHLDRDPENAEAYLKKLRAHHYGNLTLIDRKVEKVIAALEERGELEETIIIYSADHGSMLGEYSNFHKGLIQERSARVPFVVHCPARYKAKRTDALCGGVDLLPTLLAMAGGEIPDAIDGKDITPILEGRKKSIGDFAIIEIHHNIGIVTNRWKLFWHNNGEGELYDFANDKAERHNLWDDPAYAKQREKLQGMLIEFNGDFAKYREKVPPVVGEQKAEYRYVQGDVVTPAKDYSAPQVADKNVHVRAVVSAKGGKVCDGPIFSCQERNRAWPMTETMNGFVVYVKDGRPCIGVRWWQDDLILRGKEKLPGGEVVVEAALSKHGKVVLMVNGEVVAEDESKGFMPKRPGRQEKLAAFIHVGVNSKWQDPIGDYVRKNDFAGKIKEVVMKVS